MKSINSNNGTNPASSGLVARPHWPSARLMSDDVRPIALVIMMGASAGLMLASWNLFPEGAHGMYATNAVSYLATLAILSGFWLRTTLPAFPAVLTGILCGIVVVLIGVGYHAHSDAIEFWCCSLGGLMAFGAAAQL